MGIVLDLPVIQPIIKMYNFKPNYFNLNKLLAFLLLISFCSGDDISFKRPKAMATNDDLIAMSNGQEKAGKYYDVTKTDQSEQNQNEIKYQKKGNNDQAEGVNKAISVTKEFGETEVRKGQFDQIQLSSQHEYSPESIGIWKKKLGKSKMCALLCEPPDSERNDNSNADIKNGRVNMNYDVSKMDGVDNNSNDYNNIINGHSKAMNGKLRRSFKRFKKSRIEKIKRKAKNKFGVKRHRQNNAIARHIETESRSLKRFKRAVKPSDSFESQSLGESEELKVNNYVEIVDRIRKNPAVVYLISPFAYADSDKSNAIVMNFSPFKILGVDEREQSMTVSSFVIVRWRDDSLRWPPEDNDNIDLISLKTSEIWTPDILVPRANGDGFRLPKPEYAVIKSTKKLNVKMKVLFKFTISCDLDMRLYPFDTQECPIMFVDEADRPLRAMDIDDGDDDMQDYFGTVGEWEIEKKSLDKLDNSSTVYFRHSVQFTITIKRRSAFYIANLLVPLYITSFIALFVFWIPPETGEKVSFMVSMYVSTAMYLSIINDVLPRSLNELPSFNIIIVLVNAQIGLTFLVTLIVLRAYRRHLEEEKNNETKEKQPPDQTNGRDTRPLQRPPINDTRYRPLTPDIFHIRKRTGRVEDIKMYATSTDSGKQTPSPRSSRSNSPSSNSRVGNLEDSLASSHDAGLFPHNTDMSSDTHTNSGHGINHVEMAAKQCLTFWTDYRRLDKVFFVIFTIGFFLSLFLPWVIHF